MPNPVPAAATGLPPEPETLEPFVVTTTYCDGLTMVDLGANGIARLTFFEEQRSLESGGQTNRIAVARLVMPQAALLKAAARILGPTIDASPSLETWPSHIAGGRA